MLRIFGIAAVAAAVAVASPVAAKQKRKRTPAAEYTQVVRAPACQRLCNTDMTPCDPPEFKRVDGRCDSGAYGGGMR